MADLSVRQVVRVAATGASLAFVAGYTNAVCLQALFSTPASHVTGIVTVVARAAVLSQGVGRPPRSGVSDVLALVGFVVGAFGAGAAIGPALYYRMRFTVRHGIALLLQSVALLCAWLLTDHGSLAGPFFAAAAMGMQNGMSTVYSGALLRTTHMTGVVTDLGVLLGQRLHQAVHCAVGKPEERPLVRTELWRLKFLLPVLIGFFLGAVTGVEAYLSFALTALALPVCASAFGGVAAIVYDVHKNRREQRRSPFSRMYDKTVALLAPYRASTKSGKEFGGPNDAFISDGDLKDLGFAVVAQAQSSPDAEAHSVRSSIVAAASSDPAVAALGVRGDWDSLPYTLFMRAKQQQMLQQEPPPLNDAEPQPPRHREHFDFRRLSGEWSPRSHLQANSSTELRMSGSSAV